jgi:hypothetical protein
MNCRISTFAALLLDIHTQRKTTRRGVYVKPEDDKDAQKLNYLKATRVRNTGYGVPREKIAVSTGNPAEWQEQDIGYHSRYGAEEETHGQLEPEGRETLPLQDYESQALLEQRREDKLPMAWQEQD